MRRYELPEWLRRHSGLVLVAAESLARALAAAGERVKMESVLAAAYLHDIGKSPLLEGDSRDHNELSALVLAAEGMPELAELVRRHIVYAITDPELVPRTIEEKIVYYADRRAGLEIVSIDDRLREQAGRFPDSADAIMACLEPARALERELFAKIPFPPERLCARP
jgi:putative nucleotidyltransferase with HDIG domain